MKRGANPATLQAAENLGVVAEFIQRPGAADLSLVWDLGYTLAAWKIEDPVETFDRNGVEYTDVGRVFIGNGMPDAAELYLLQTVLKRPDLDLSARSGIVEEFAWQAWSANLTQVQNDLPGLDPRIQRTVAAYMTLGDYITASSMKELVETNTGVTLDINNYDRSQQHFFYSEHDADNNGTTNREDWQTASPDSSLLDLEAFAAAALGESQASSSSGSHASAKAASANQIPCPNDTCLETGSVTLNPYAVTSDGTQVNFDGCSTAFIPSDLVMPQKLGALIPVRAVPDEDNGWGFLNWGTISWSSIEIPSTISGSRDRHEWLRIMDNYHISLPARFSRGILYVSTGPDVEITVTPGKGVVRLPDESDAYMRYAGPPGSTVRAFAKSKIAGQHVSAWQRYYNPTSWSDTIEVVLPSSDIVSIRPHLEPDAPNGPRRTVNVVFERNQCGIIVGTLYCNPTGHGDAYTSGMTLDRDMLESWWYLSLTATPNPGFEFDHWEKCPGAETSSRHRTISPVITSDALFEASFVPAEEYTFEILDSQLINGKVAPCSGYVTTSLPRKKYYDRDDQVTLVAHPNPGYQFVHWDGDGAVYDSTYTLVDLCGCHDPGINIPMEPQANGVNGESTRNRMIWPVFASDTVINAITGQLHVAAPNTSPPTYETSDLGSVPGHYTNGFNPHPAYPNTDPGPHLPVFYDTVCDTNSLSANQVQDGPFNLKGFYVTLQAEPSCQEWSGPVTWSIVAQPQHSAPVIEQDLGDKWKAKLSGLTSGGVCVVRIDVGEGWAPSCVYVVMPLAGAEVSQRVANDLVRANAFTTWALATYSELQMLDQLNGWFNDGGGGDYWGRPDAPDNFETATVIKYNGITQGQLGGVGTWYGVPTRESKISNFIVGYTIGKLGYGSLAAQIATWIGTADDAAASQSYWTGFHLSSNGQASGPAMKALALQLWALSDPKNRRLWPNTNQLTNYVVDHQVHRLYVDFSSPEFLNAPNPQ